MNKDKFLDVLDDVRDFLCSAITLLGMLAVVFLMLGLAGGFIWLAVLIAIRSHWLWLILYVPFAGVPTMAILAIILETIQAAVKDKVDIDDYYGGW